MQRVKAPAGRLTLEQWRGLAHLAARYTPDYPLHATTRQNIELHGVLEKDLPVLQHEIAALNLTGAAACGDAVRNITVCPRNGCCSGTWNINGVVCAIRSVVETLPWRTSLPRKFKISVSGCRDSCGRPWLNDVGLVANEDGTFRVILAGSLGAKPGLGVLAYESLPIDEVLPLIVAALRLFHAEGERTNRSRARLRHLREQLGNEVFLARIEELLQIEKRESSWPAPTFRRVEKELPLVDRLVLPLGDISPELVLELMDAVEAVGAEVRLGMEHDLLILGGAKPVLSPKLAVLSGGNVVVACPGATWCTKGFVDCRAVAGRISAALPHSCGLVVGSTGCPNNCSQAATMDIGLVGRMLRRNGHEHVQGFRVFAGGGKGVIPTLAQELHPGLPAETVHEAVSWIIEEYHLAQNGSSLSFADFVAKSGQSIRDDLVRRYDHWNSGF
jgi:sulfite reductase beta subunit-like hemoprotein